jgi:hypothetical protein
MQSSTLLGQHITEVYEVTKQLHGMKYINLGVDTIRQDPALTLEPEEVIAVELGEAPEKEVKN